MDMYGSLKNGALCHLVKMTKSHLLWPEAEIMKKIAANPVDERMG